MKLQTTCTKCGSDHVRLNDFQSLYLPTPREEEIENASEEYLKEIYQWDEEIYASTICDNCGTTSEVQGTIKWNV